MAQKRKRSKKWISWVVILVLLIVAGVVAYLVWDNYFRDNKGDTGTETSQMETDDKKKEDKKESEKQEKEKDDNSKTEQIPEKKVEQYDGGDANQNAELSGVITYAGVNGGTLMIRVNIDQYLEGGTCSLDLRNGGMNVYSATAAIVSGAATSTCEGFDVPVAGLAGGNTVIVIDLESGGKTGEIIGEVAI